MRRVIQLAALATLASGSAEAQPARPRSAPLAADLAAWVGPSPDDAPPSTTISPAPARSLASSNADPGARYEARRIAPPPVATPRPKRQGRVNVSFQGADMVQAFQFLADAGRFNLVMAEGLTGKVSATLRGVDPYDALVSLAEANGATVRFDKRIVVVRKR